MIVVKLTSYRLGIDLTEGHVDKLAQFCRVAEGFQKQARVLDEAACKCLSEGLLLSRRNGWYSTKQTTLQELLKRVETTVNTSREAHRQTTLHPELPKNPI